MISRTVMSRIMISKTIRIARMIVLTSVALSSAAWAAGSTATCCDASLSGTYWVSARRRDPTRRPCSRRDAAHVRPS